jgi:hypothetical protein
MQPVKKLKLNCFNNQEQKMSEIQWDKVVEEIKSHQGDVRTIGVDFYQNIDGRFSTIIELWNKAGYTPEKVEWINFYPEKHFDKNVVHQFADNVKLKTIRAWISCVRPGKSAPWHQDIDDSMEEYEKLGKLIRYSVTINEPKFGQFFSIDKEPYYMLPKGTVILWSNYMEWHGASNCSFENHYLFHFIGYI